MLHSNATAQKFFNMTGRELFKAVRSNKIPLSDLSRALDKRLLSLNVYYSQTAYTSIKEDPKTQVPGFYLIFFGDSILF
jgi:hypothetical protein